MPLDLHPNLKARLRELLALALPRINITNNSYLDFGSLPNLVPLDAALPDAKTELHQKLISYIGHVPLRDFLVGVLSDELHIRPFEPEGPRRPLTDLPEYADVPAVVTRLINDFDSLPRTYSVLVSVPHNAALVLGPAVHAPGLQLTPEIKLVTMPEAGGSYQLQPQEEGGLLLAAFGRKPAGATPGILYLANTVHGYIPSVGSSAALESASFIARAFFGLCIAQLLLRRGRAFHMGGPRHRYLLVYTQSAAPYPLLNADEFPIDVSEAIDSLTIDAFFAEKISAERRPAIVLQDLENIGAAMALHSEDDRLLRAAQWLFDSYADTNPLLTFVQAMISLEILLGDKAISDVVGLGELLGNRCAFLVGKTRKQRDKILVDFRRIYETRSKIVHRGHNRLSPEEENDLWMLRWLCSRVIQEEMRLLLADRAG